jgi:hypothetical protein
MSIVQYIVPFTWGRSAFTVNVAMRAASEHFDAQALSLYNVKLRGNFILPCGAFCSDSQGHMALRSRCVDTKKCGSQYT